MKKLNTTALLTLLTLSALTGCKSVTSDHLIGVPISLEEAESYEGAWKIGDGVMHVKHVEGGELVAAGLEWSDEKGAFEANNMHITITTHAEAKFVQMLAEEDEDESEVAGEAPVEDIADEAGDTPWLLIGMMAASGDDALVIYSPEFERFETAIRDGELVGEVDEEGNNMHVQGEKAALDAYITKDRLHELFQTGDPGVLTRVGNVE